MVIRPGQRCTSPDGTDLGDLASLGVRTWGSAGPSATVFVTGVYERRAEVGHRLLTTLPHLLVLAPGAWNAPLIDYLVAEIDRDVLGLAASSTGSSTCSSWLPCANGSTVRTPAPWAWCRAQAEPLVGPVLALIHDQPDHPWSLAGLAAAVGWSRSTLAKRFAQLVGYGSGFALSVAFKRVKGVSPAEHRAARTAGASTISACPPCGTEMMTWT